MVTNNSKEDLKNLSEFLNKDPDKFSIFEEEIDVELQKEFYAYMEELSPKLDEKENTSLENVDKLYDKNIPSDEKRLILLLLSNLNEVKAYRAIEEFIKKGDKELKKWATIALQQSRIMMESSLITEKSIFISTGLGGKGDKLRYFCVFFTQKINKLKKSEKDILKKEIEFAFRKRKAILETLEFTMGIVTFKALIPLETNIKDMFNSIITEINNYGNILRANMIITNVKSLTIKEIEDLLKQKSED